MNFAKNISSILTSAFLFALQTAHSAEVDDTITVTAVKTATDILSTPASVDVLSGAKLRSLSGLSSAEEITRLLSGVQAAVANGNQISFQIRGIGAVDHQALTPGAAAVYADGVFLATNAQTGPILYDLERVEVLKGPQGSLYGRNASSGAINFISARPTDDLHGYLGWSFGSFDRVDAIGAISGPLSAGVSARIAGRVIKSDAALSNVQSDSDFPRGLDPAGGKRDEFGVKSTIVWQAGGPEILFRAHYEEDNGVNPAPLNSSLMLGDHEISVGADGVQETDNEFYGASIEANADFGSWRLFSLTAFEGYNQDYGFDFDGTPAPFGNPTLNANLHYDRQFSQWSEEFRAERKWGGVRSLFGVAAASEEFDQEYLIWCGELDPATLIGTCRYVGAPGRVGPSPASPGTAATLLTTIRQSRKTAAVFTFHEIQLNAALTLSLGGRYTYEDIKGEGTGVHIFDDGVRDFNNRGGLGPANGANRIEENRFSGNAALTYRVHEATVVYASFSNGYKSGGFNGEVQNNATHFQDEGLFSAETVNAWELGGKSRLGDDLSINAAFFYQDYNAPQARIFVNFPLPDGTSITSNSLSNLDAAKALGLEASFDWQPTQKFQVGTTATFLDTKIRQRSDIGGNVSTFDGNPLPFASEYSVAAFARYDAQLAGDVAVSLQTNAKYQSRFFLDAEGLLERSQKQYVLIDAMAAVEFGQDGFELSVQGRNLLNEQYAVSGFGFIGYNTFLGGPRSVNIQIRKIF